ncbi:MAG TPA: LuxR C-terminal-related transcriptional regulator [Coleofasciculaceae cyanobacterium]
MDDLQDYGLTASEAEVWFLRQAGLTHQAIAEQLQMAETTVKKHINNVQAKRHAEQSELQPLSPGLLDVGFWINVPE